MYSYELHTNSTDGMTNLFFIKITENSYNKNQTLSKPHKAPMIKIKPKKRKNK